MLASGVAKRGAAAPIMKLRYALLSLIPLAALLAMPSCAEETEPVQTNLCEPGSNIFCRCPGGDPGTKPCADDGSSFGECGPCDPRMSTGPGTTTSSSSSSSGQGGGGQGGAGQGGNVTPGTGPLLSPCDAHGDCISTVCLNGYCTMVCNLVSECPYPASECANFNDGQTLCMPTCRKALDCKPFEAPPSLCGYTKAVDNWDVTVCGHWDTQHALMPIDTDCVPFDHEACNLGYPEREIVCTEQGLCKQGCFSQNDCPTGKSCNGNGGQGTCN
jgi:hypothetical protein